MSRLAQRTLVRYYFYPRERCIAEPANSIQLFVCKRITEAVEQERSDRASDRTSSSSHANPPLRQGEKPYDLRRVRRYHTLAFYRSQHEQQSWVGALTVILFSIGDIRF
jgi:hypothetical protein